MRKFSTIWLTPAVLTLIAFCSIAVGMDGVADDDPGDDLPRKMKQALDNEIFPSLKQGADVYFYNAFGRILSKATPEQAEKIDQYAKSVQLGSPLDKFVDLKLKRIEQGIDAVDNKMKLSEAVFLIGGINKRLKEFIATVNTHPFMQEPVEVSEDWKDARDQFWDAHVAKNEFLNNSVILAFGDGILEPVKTAAKNSKDTHTLKTFSEFASLSDAFGETYQDLDERTIEARLIRFERSAETILDDKSFEDKLVAAMSLQIDAESLIPLLQENLVLNRPKLKQQGLADQLNAKTHELLAAEPTIIEKAHLLRTGLHWWLRGRYGHGVEHGGLMKSKNVFLLPENIRRRSGAANSPMNLELLNALYMPRKRPKPEFELTLLKPAASSISSPHYSRRHYYTWAIEKRPIITTVKTSTSSKTVGSSTQSRIVNQSTESGRFFY